MEIVDKQVREDIINANGSIVVSASAGSGKTTIMIKKILKKMEEISDHKTVAAITFTTKATQEIQIKLKQHKNIIVMTNDSFIEREIIRPFIMDAFDGHFSNDFIISYEQINKFNSFADGLIILKNNNKLGTYFDNNKNFKFELAKRILDRSQAAREYLKAKYTMIFLDEYQDSDADMHSLFMYIKNKLMIDLFIVGDSKQAIYLWRGAQKNIFAQLENEGMQSFKLITNFRSDFEIVNYANLMHDTAQVIDCDLKVTNAILCRTNDCIQSIIALCESGIVDKNKEITIIANRHDDAKSIADSLNEEGFNFLYIPKTPLDSGTENSRILRAIACYLLDDNYFVYNIAEVLSVEQTKTYLDRIVKILDSLKTIVPLKPNHSKNDIRSDFFEAINTFNEHFGTSISNDEKEILLEGVTNKSFYPAFIESDNLHKIMTVFASKGLEFDQVISFARYYNFNDESSINNHYVCITRAKDKLVMLETVSEHYLEQVSKKIKDSNIKYYETPLQFINHI